MRPQKSRMEEFRRSGFGLFARSAILGAPLPRRRRQAGQKTKSPGKTKSPDNLEERPVRTPTARQRPTYGLEVDSNETGGGRASQLWGTQDFFEEEEPTSRNASPMKRETFWRRRRMCQRIQTQYAVS